MTAAAGGAAEAAGSTGAGGAVEEGLQAGRRRFFQASPAEEGERLDVVLAAWLGESRSRAAFHIAADRVRVEGVVADKSHRLRAGEEVSVEAPPPQPTGAAGAAPPPVRYSDEHLLVVAKPAGMVVHPGTGRPAGTLVQALAEAGERLAPAGGEHRPGVVHRLDRGTSGLLVLARTDRAHTRLVGALKRREVERGYLTLVQGTPPAERGRVEVPLGRDPSRPTRFAPAPGGLRAVTRWRVLAAGHVPEGRGSAAGEGVSLLRIRPETGRTHQIRVHLSHAGHPVVADPDYGARRDLAEALSLDRPFLHAAWLAFDHPVTGRRVAVAEPLPGELAAACRTVGVPADLPGEWRQAESGR